MKNIEVIIRLKWQGNDLETISESEMAGEIRKELRNKLGFTPAIADSAEITVVSSPVEVAQVS